MIRTGIETRRWPIEVAACCDCGFESRRWHGSLSVVGVVFCLEEAFATGRSLVQSSPTDGVCVCARARARKTHET